MWDDGPSQEYYDTELIARRDRPLGGERLARMDWFIAECRSRGHSSVVEVGSGAGRDGVRMRAGGLTYRGVDLSPVGVDICTSLGLDTQVAPATDLPFADDEFDAGWTMSTLMHLPGDEIVVALEQIHRVVKHGGLLAVGVWGSTAANTRIDEHGRRFEQRTDEQLRSLLTRIGTVEQFETWSWFDNGGHYQWAAVAVR